MSKKSDFSIPGEEMIIADNGTPIYYYLNEYLHGFFIGLYIKAGSMYETDDMNGSTHLWEHIIFRKLNQLNNGTFYQMLDTLGLSFVLPAYTDNAELILDAVEDLNWNMAYECHIMNCKYKNIEERKIAYRNITPVRIMEIAREVFVLDNLVFTIKTDKKDLIWRRYVRFWLIYNMVNKKNNRNNCRFRKINTFK